MDPWLIVVIMIGSLLVLAVLGMPIAFAIALSGSLGLVLITDWGTLLYALGSFPVSRIANYAWACLPLFILLGNLVHASGVAADAYDMAHKWFGKVRGGLVIATITASGLVASTTGSGATSIVIMGKIAVPEMEKLGYDRSLAVGATASSGPLGVLIPPSLAFVYVGILAEVSIGKLFIAGILPGILSVVAFSLMVYVRCRLNPRLAPTSVSFSWRERFFSLRKALGALIIFIVILGGLYTGIATPIEVSALGCLVALIMVFMAMRSGKSSWQQLWQAVTDSIGISAMIFAFIIGAGIFSLFVTLSGLVQQSVGLIQGFGLPTLVILVFVVIIFFVMGMFFDPTSMIMLGVPIFYPILVGGLGVDPIWLSVIVVIMSEVGALTPPVGMALFVMQGVYPRASLIEIARGSAWFVAMNLVVIALLFAFPQISTWLPDMMW